MIPVVLSFYSRELTLIDYEFSAELRHWSLTPSILNFMIVNKHWGSGSSHIKVDTSCGAVCRLNRGIF